MGPIILSAFFVLYGIAYLAFAFREPPAALASFFRVPFFFAFFPAEGRMKYGRLTIGVLCILTPVIVAYRIVFWSP
jgi:hypothetical protein